jgi:hypothetical protein
MFKCCGIELKFDAAVSYKLNNDIAIFKDARRIPEKINEIRGLQFDIKSIK